LSAICLIAVQHWDISPIWNGTLRTLLIVIVILLSTLSLLAQTGTKICLTKDWVVVICNDEKDKLAGNIIFGMQYIVQRSANYVNIY
jgi:hypothetical protein